MRAFQMEEQTSKQSSEIQNKQSDNDQYKSPNKQNAKKKQ